MRKFVVWTSITAGVLICLAALLGLAFWSISGFAGSNADAAKQYAQWKQNGLPNIASEVDQRNVPDEQNAYPLLMKIAKNAGGSVKKSISVPTDVYTEESWREGRTATYLKTYQEEMDRVAIATEKPYYDAKRDWDKGYSLMFPEFAVTKSWVKLFCLDAKWRARSGDAEGAIARLEAARKLGGLTSQDPTLIALLVGVAVESITLRAAGNIASDLAENPSALRSLRDMLKKTEWTPDFVHIFRGEAYTELATLRNLTTKDIYEEVRYREYPSPPDSQYKVKDGLPSNPPAKAVAAEAMRFWNEFQPRITAGESDMKLGMDMDSGGMALKGDNNLPKSLAGMNHPVYVPTFTARDKMLTERMALNSFIAALLYRSQHNRWPTGLAATGLTPAETTDLAAKTPLGYRAAGKEVRVWHVDRDGKDNGGRTPQEAAAAKTSGFDAVYMHPWPKVHRKPGAAKP